MPSTACRPNELFRNILEEQFQSHTNRLTELTVYARLPRQGGYDRGTIDVLAGAARQGIADTAQALRRMAEGTYGVCELCDHDIPMGRLRAVPHARYCVRCERTLPR